MDEIILSIKHFKKSGHFIFGDNIVPCLILKLNVDIKGGCIPDVIKNNRNAYLRPAILNGKIAKRPQLDSDPRAMFCQKCLFGDFRLRLRFK